MASSRESSPPSEAGSPSSAQLTPNSKVKAMLAAFDKDSDDESVSGSVRTRLLSSITKAASNSTKTARTTKEATGPKDISRGTIQEDSDDDEEEEIVRPKGRMAARMLAEENKSEEDEPAADDARERVRKMLMPKGKLLEPAANTEEWDGSGEEDAPVASRKRKIRVPRLETPRSSPVRASASPGLFVSPKLGRVPSASGDASESDELPDNPGANDRFLALVAKKREGRLAREAELAKEKAKKAEERKRYSSILEEEDRFDDSDDNVERRLTQQARPSRKASKKALEEMHRETQRLSRNQQLAHNAITKKKITKASLFAKFNYKLAGHIEEQTPEPVRPTSSSSSAPHSDMEMKDTPPTSPASHGEENLKPFIASTLPLAASEVKEHNTVEDLPNIEEVRSHVPSSPPLSLDKGKGKAIKEPASEPEISKKSVFTKRPIRVRPPKITDRKAPMMDDSDSDLEIVNAKAPILKKKLESIFDRVPAKQAKESHPIHVLRMFANLTSPGKQNTGRNKKPSMTTTELQVSLQQRARQQAAREREERLQALRDKGIIVQTAEEREKEMADVDDLLAKARREDEELMKREKAAAKKEHKDKGEVDPLGDSSDDEDWEEGKEDIPEEISVSGSDDELEIASGDEGNSCEEEEEEEEEDESMAVDGEDVPSNPMFDNEAAESDSDESEADSSIDDGAEDGYVDEDEEEGEQQLPAKQKPRRTRNPNVISDDEDGDEDINVQPSPLKPRNESPLQLHTESPMAPNSVLRSATKTFIPGLTVAGPAGLGLTQIFAGTMDESQMDPFETSPEAQNGTKQDSLAFLRQLPPPELPSFVPTMAEDTQDAHVKSPSQLSHIPESQLMDSETQGIELNFSQSHIHGFDSLVQDTQLSQFPEATQDAGFQHMTPIRGRFVDAPPSTVDTVMLDPRAVPETTEETPIVKKKGKLRRRAQVASFSDEEDTAHLTEVNVDEDEFDITSNAFDVMRKASKKRIVVDEFDKKKSKAKEMVNEQAEESEDEYAGLGGASDDESGEEDAYAKEIIDDEGGKDVDERKLAAFFA
jgi:mediator of replication checkpoint protein 1